MLDGEVLYAKGLVYKEFLNARIIRSRFFTEGIIDGEVMSVFIMDAGSPGVKLQDVLMKTWRIRDLDLDA